MQNHAAIVNQQIEQKVDLYPSFWFTDVYPSANLRVAVFF